MVQTKTEMTRNIKKYKIGDMNPCDLMRKTCILRKSVVDSFRTYDTYDFCDNLYKYVIYQECSEFLGIERIFGSYRPFSVGEFSSLLDQDNKVWEFRAILNIHVKNLLLLGEIDSFYKKLLRSKILGNIKERNYFKKMCISHYTYSEIQELIYNYETVFMDLTTKYKHTPLPFMTDNNTSWINKLSNSCVTDTVVPEDPETKWKLKNVFMGEEVEYSYVDKYDELPPELRPKDLYEEPLNLNGVLKVPKNKEENEMGKAKSKNRKAKSISYILSSHIPDYEEIYMGIKWTYGVNMIGDIDVSFEIDAIDDIKILDSEYFNDSTLIKGIDKGYVEITELPNSWIGKTSERILLANTEITLYSDSSYYPEFALFVRNIGNTLDGRNLAWITEERLNLARMKFRDTLRKREPLQIYIGRTNTMKKQPSFDETKGMSETDIAEFVNKKFGSILVNNKRRYFTHDMIVDMCHKFIDAIIDKITRYNIELYK